MPPTVLEWIDDIADQFETAWQQGATPRLTDFLGDAQGERRLALLEELILIDDEYRFRKGLRRSLAGYLDEFPELRGPGGALPERLRARLTEDSETLRPHATPHADTMTAAPGLRCRKCERLLPEVPAHAWEIRCNGCGSTFRVDWGRQRSASEFPCIPDFEIVELLGKGGMGVVYKAAQTSLKRLVAIKMILGGARVEPVMIARFRREAQALAQLQHPQTVQVFEVGEHEGCPYFVMEFVAGGSLSKQLDGKPLPSRQAARLLETLARAMHAAHQRGIVHRDLKPANVLVTTDDIPKISDFGLVKRLDEEAGQTQTGAIMGTPSYMAPEQARGESVLGPACDIHALGAILYELLTGRPPYLGATVMETLKQACEQEPVAPRLLNPQAPRDLETICLKCLSKEPAQRYPSADALADDLCRFQAGEPILARPAGHAERAWRWCRRNPALAWVGTVAIAAVVAALVSLASGVVLIDQARQKAVTLAGEKELLAKKADDSKQQALKFAAEKDSLARKANEARAEAFQRAAERDVQIAAMKFEQAYARCARGDTVGGLLALAQSLSEAEQLEAGDLARSIRLHLTAWSRNVHPVAAAVRMPEEPWSWRTAFSTDSQWICCLDSKTMTVYRGRLADGQFAKISLNHSGEITAYDFSVDGKLLATASQDGTIQLWRSATGEPFGPPRKSGTSINKVQFCAQGNRFLSFGDARVRVWEVDSAEKGAPPPGENVAHWVAAFSPDGQYVFTHERKSPKIDAPGAAGTAPRLTGETKCVSVKGETLWTLPGLLTAAKLSPDGRTLIVIRGDGHGLSLGDTHHVQAVEAATGKPIGPNWQIQCGLRGLHVDFSSDNVHALIAQDNSVDGLGEVWLWQVGTEQKRLLPNSSDQNVRVATFHPQGQEILLQTGDYSGPRECRLLEAYSGRSIGLPWPCNGIVSWSPDGKHLLSRNGSNFFVWQMQTEPLGVPLPWGGATYVAFHPNGQWLAVSRTIPGPPNRKSTGEVRILDLATQQWRSGPSLHEDTIEGGLQFINDGRHLFTFDGAGIMRVLDGENSQWTSPTWLPGHRSWTYDLKALAFGKDRYAALAPEGLKLFAFPSGRDLGVLAPDREVRIGVFSPDGKRYLATTPGAVKLWDIATRTMVREFPAQKGTVTCLAFRPDGKAFIAGSEQTAQIWEIETGQPRVSVTVPRKNVGSVQFSPDGRLLLTAAQELGNNPMQVCAREVQLWEARDGRKLGPPLVTNHYFAALAFTPSGAHMLTVSQGSPDAGRIQRWRVSPVAGNAAQVRLWAEVLTGFELDAAGAVRPLEPVAWLKRRDALGTMSRLP